MKKLISIFLIVTLLLGMTGCTQDNRDTQVSQSDPRINEDLPDEQVETTSTKTEVSDLADMYIVALDSMMDIDSGLNGNMKYIAIDCDTLEDIDENDIEAILLYFSEKYNIDTMNKSVAQCYDEGYGDEQNLLLDGIVLYFDSVNYNMKTNATFTCVKYRSGLGAIGVTVKLKYKDEWLVEEAEMTWIS